MPIADDIRRALRRTTRRPRASAARLHAIWRADRMFGARLLIAAAAGVAQWFVPPADLRSGVAHALLSFAIPRRRYRAGAAPLVQRAPRSVLMVQRASARQQVDQPHQPDALGAEPDLLIPLGHHDRAAVSSIDLGSRISSARSQV